MTDYGALYAATLPALTALSGVALGAAGEAWRDGRRATAESEARAEERLAGAALRRRDFELEHLLKVYDAIWLLLRHAAEIHLHDVRAARAGQGYGGTQIEGSAGDDLSVAREATRLIRLILDDDLRRAAEAMSTRIAEVGLLGVTARMLDRPLVTEVEGTAQYSEAVLAGDRVMARIAERVRELSSERRD